MMLFSKYSLTILKLLLHNSFQGKNTFHMENLLVHIFLKKVNNKITPFPNYLLKIILARSWYLSLSSSVLVFIPSNFTNAREHSLQFFW